MPKYVVHNGEIMANEKKSKNKRKMPPKWSRVYPVGTKEGDEECRFFKVLARNAKYEWRSVGALAKESGLNKKRIEEILTKYYKKGMIFQNPANEDQWGYWERVPNMVPEKNTSIAKKDQESRIDSALKSTSVLNQNGQSCSASPKKQCVVDWIPIL